MSLLDYVINRFPIRAETIKTLFHNSPTFREICADYAEMVIWLEDYRREGKKPSDNYNHASAVLIELEAELIKCLEGRHVTVASENNNCAN